MAAVTMVPPVSGVGSGVVMAVWADVNLFCGCDSLRSGRLGTLGAVKNVSPSYCKGKGPGWIFVRQSEKRMTFSLFS